MVANLQVKTVTRTLHKVRVRRSWFGKAILQVSFVTETHILSVTPMLHPAKHHTKFRDADMNNPEEVREVLAYLNREEPYTFS